MKEREEKITFESALQNEHLEFITTAYEDQDYKVFRERSIKENQTLWLHIHDSAGTGIFINEHQFLKIVSTWSEFYDLRQILT